MILVLQAGHPHEADSFIVLGTWERGRLDMRNAPVLYAGQDAAAGIGMAVGIANGAQDPSFGHRGSPSEAGTSPPPFALSLLRLCRNSGDGRKSLFSRGVLPLKFKNNSL